MRPSKLFHPTRLREVRFIQKWLATLPEGPVCDFGCGDGVYSRWVAGRRAVVGFDPSESHVRKASKDLSDETGNALFFVGDATRTALRDASFASVVSVCVLEHVPDIGRAIGEVNRVLRPGGAFLFTVDSLDEPHTPDDYVAYHRNRFYIADFLTLERVRALLDAYRFEMLECQSIGNNRFSGTVLRLFARRYSVYRWFSPLLSASVWLADKICNAPDHGYILLFAARKKGQR